MLNGIQSNARAMEALMIRQDTLANNLANADTAGFKRDEVAFAQVLSARGGGLETRQARDLSDGAFRRTDNPTDAAVMGAGYFAVQTPEGLRYTRSGAFQLDAKGALIDGAGNPVLGATGPLRIPPEAAGPLTMNEDGDLSVGGTAVGKLRIVHFSPDAELRKEGRGLHALVNGATVEGRSRVIQGYLEGSNVNSVTEMVDMMDTLRLFEANQRSIRIQDESLGRAVNELGR